MSVLMEFAMFPTDKGESVSPYVSRIIAMLRDKNVAYQLTPMGTIVEVETIGEATALINEAYRALEEDCNRVYCTAKFDIRKGEAGRMNQKVEAIKRHIGNVNT